MPRLPCACWNIDLLLSDVVLPGGIDGFELASEARKLYPTLRILFVSGYPQDALQRQDNEGWVSALLQKPYTAKVLAQTLRRTLSD
jgi:CheY-like chemotaxis protein